MTPRTRTLLLGFALLGLAASAASSYVHHQLLTSPTYTSFCDVSATVSCTQAYLSRYGSFAGVPVAILGVIFFAVVLAMVALAPKPPVVAPRKKPRGDERPAVTGENVPGYVFALSTIGLAFSLYLAWASFFQLGALCLLCAATYVAVAGLFVVSARATAFPMTSLPGRAARDAAAAAGSPLALAVVAVLAIGAWMAIASFRDRSDTTAATQHGHTHPPLTDGQRIEFERWFDVQPVVDVPVDKGNARIAVVKFNDYQCPPCRETYEEYKGILARYTASGQIRYVLKHFPLELECNAQNAGHYAACEAAAAVIMAEKKGTAEKLEAWLFANQGPPLLSPDKVRTAAADIGGVTDFAAQYPAVLEQVKADVALGAKIGAKSTPTFVINGRLISGGLPPPAFELAIELELKRAK